MNKFSIIMAAYNAEKEIERSIKSVLNQTFKDYEFIVVNDASTDMTSEIVSKYSDVKLINHTENKRAGGARNTGIENATGEYIIFLDSDDIFADENVLSRINEKIGADITDVIYLGFEAVGDGFEGKFIPTEHNSIKANRIIEWNYANVWDVVWNRDFLNKNNIRFVEKKYFEDFVFYYTGILKSSSYKYTDFTSIIYRSGRSDSMTTLINPKKMQDLYYNMEVLLDIYNDLDDEYKKFIPYILKDHNDYANRLLDQMK